MAGWAGEVGEQGGRIRNDGKAIWGRMRRPSSFLFEIAHRAGTRQDS